MQSAPETQLADQALLYEVAVLAARKSVAAPYDEDLANWAGNAVRSLATHSGLPVADVMVAVKRRAERPLFRVEPGDYEEGLVECRPFPFQP